MNRRDFIRGAAGAALTLGVVSGSAMGEETRSAGADGNASADSSPELRKAFVFSMLPDSRSVEDRFKLARDIGLQGVEVSPTDDPELRRTLRTASERTGVRIHSIIFGGWSAPLSSPDESVADKGAEDLADALECAREMGADNVLLVPAVVNESTRYIEAYERSQKRLRKLIPAAEKNKVRILVENVWNNFLLSPIEFARYVDEFKSPWIQAYFDVGNVVAFGWPEDWIRTLGARIRKVHLKDFKRGPRQWCNLRDGDVNWNQVRRALSEVRYSGFVTVEMSGGDEAYLRDIAKRVDAIIAETV